MIIITKRTNVRSLVFNTTDNRRYSSVYMTTAVTVSDASYVIKVKNIVTHTALSVRKDPEV